MTSSRFRSTPFALLGLAACLSSSFAQPAAPAAQAEGTVALSEFEVRADQDRGYASTNAVGGTRFNTALANIPQAVIVLNQDFMKDIGARSVVDAAQYVSGVSTTAGPAREVFVVRGYQIDVTTDGLPDSSPTAQGLSTSFELLDRVEIIKGPAAVLYGSTSPGGNVNRITKKPVFRDQGTLEASVGEGGFRHGMIDVNRSHSLGQNSAVALRLVAAHEHYDQYVTFGDANSYFIAPMLGWKIGPQTTLVVTPYYLDRNYHKVFGTLFQFRPFTSAGPLSFNLPRDVDWGGDYAREKFTVRRLYAQLDHQIMDRWSLRLSAIAKNHNEYNNDIIPRDLLPDNRTMQRTWRIIRTEGNYRLAALDSLIDWEIAKTKNKTLFVAQYYKTEIDPSIETGRKLSGQQAVRGENADSSFSNLPLLDVFNPDPIALNARPEITFISSRTHSEGEVLAFSLQHQITLFDDRLVANAGLRHDRTQSFGENRLTNRVTVDRSNRHTTKRAGALFKVLPGLGVFYNHSETFSPQFALNPDGTGFRPTEGVIDEAGVKTDLLQGRISGVISAFSIENKNLIVTDPDPLRASAGFRTQSARDVIEGVEFDLHFNVVKNLQVLASYSKLRSKNQNRLRVRDVPENTMALLASYRFASRRNDEFGWTVGAGWHHRGRRPATADNVLFLEESDVVDAFVTYRHSQQWKFALNCTNVFDEYYADSAINRNVIFAGPERRARFTVTYDF